MARLIDSSVLIELERRGEPVRVITDAAPAETFALASITAAELLVGVERADTPDRRRRRAAFVEKILVEIPLLPVDLPVARVYARVWARLQIAGQRIGDHDLLIAATALANDYSVLTHDVRHFGHVPGLIVLQHTW